MASAILRSIAARVISIHLNNRLAQSVAFSFGTWFASGASIALSNFISDGVHAIIHFIYKAAWVKCLLSVAAKIASLFTLIVFLLLSLSSFCLTYIVKSIGIRRISQ